MENGNILRAPVTKSDLNVSRGIEAQIPFLLANDFAQTQLVNLSCFLLGKVAS